MFTCWNFCLLLFVPRVAANAYISVVPQNMTALAGSSATFTCHVTGSQAQGQTLHFSKLELSMPSRLALDNQLVNASKYGVSNRYDYTVYNVSPQDEGFYQCELFPQVFLAYLAVSVPPDTVSLSWPGNRMHVTRDVPVNLTCVSMRSKPPASFRWFKGFNDVTSASYSNVVQQDSHGYADATSVLEVTLGDQDETAPFTCIIDLPGAEQVTKATVWVAFSGSAHVWTTRCGPVVIWLLMLVLALIFV